jgi:hypothetical protein
VSRPHAEERECIIGTTDAEDAWRVYVDAPSRFARRLLTLAERWKVTPKLAGAGIELTLPLGAIRFASPRRMSDLQKAQLARARTARRKPLPDAGGLAATTDSAGRKGPTVS